MTVIKLAGSALVSACLLFGEHPPRPTDWPLVLRHALELSRTGRQAEAETVLRGAIARDPGGDKAALATAYNNLGSLYHELGRCEDSKKSYRRALRLYEQTGQHENGTRAAINFASMLVDCSAAEQAAQVVQRYLKTPPESISAFDRGRAFLLRANIHFARKQYEKAEAALREAFPSLATNPHADREISAFALNTLGVVLGRQGRNVEAIQALERALTLAQGETGPLYLLTPRILANIAASYRGLRRHAEANAYYMKALAAGHTALGDEHPVLAHILMDYSGFLRENRRKDESKAARQRANSILSRSAALSRTVDIADLTAESRIR